MSEIRVRFAPSPTGYLHVGGLRTALYNYLFAKHHRGKFILRIEDTDQNRFVDGAMESLMKTLRDCGLDYDEGPDTQSAYGPYIQSQRTEIYRQHAETLLSNGTAYRCFCSPERLEELKALQKLKKEAPRYDGKCRLLSDDDISEKLKNNCPFTIRLKVPENTEVKFLDDVRGWISYSTENIDDQVLLKSDMFPTYHLANVVDDHLMQISHVIRGEEWLPSTPKHILLYQAYGWDAPKFAHLPLLLNADRTKLSKRQGDVAVEDYLKKGYVLQALLNFIALLGWNAGEGSEQEFFTKEELVSLFSLERVNKAGAIFDVQKLQWMNGHYIKLMDKDRFYEFVQPFIDNDYKHIANIKDLVFLFKDNIEIASEINSHLVIFKSVEKNDLQKHREQLIPEKTKELIVFLHHAFKNSVHLDEATFKEIMKSAQEKLQIKGKELWMPFRIAVSGMEHGPDISKLVLTLGKDEIVKRLQQVINLSQEIL